MSDERVTFTSDTSSIVFNVTENSHGEANFAIDGGGEIDIAVTDVGMQGPPGEGALPYIHTQSAPSSVWTIPHNRGYLVDITIYDANDEQIIGDIRHDNDQVATITFSEPITGRARVD